MAQELGHFQQAANKLKQLAIDHRVPNADQIQLNGQLDDQWDTALRAILQDDTARSQLDYGVIREIRDDPASDLRWFRFVGGIGQTFGPFDHFDFLKLIAERARNESEGKPPATWREIYQRIGLRS